MVSRIVRVEEPLGEPERLRVPTVRQRRHDRPDWASATRWVAPSGRAICSARAVARSVSAGSPRTASIIAIAVSAVASQMGWPSSLARRRASSAAGIAISQSGRRTARMACVANRRGSTPRRPSARALSIAVAQNVRLS